MPATITFAELNARAAAYWSAQPRQPQPVLTLKGRAALDVLRARRERRLTHAVLAEIAARWNVAVSDLADVLDDVACDGACDLTA